MEKEKLEEIIKNKGIVWVVTNELKKLDFKKINKRDIHLDDEQLEIDTYYGEILRDIYQFEEVFETEAKANHCLNHANISRTTYLPFLTWEEFKKKKIFRFVSASGTDCFMQMIENKQLLFYYGRGKVESATEENFYKLYDDCVKCFMGEE